MPAKLKQLERSIFFIFFVGLAIRLIVVAFLYHGQLNPGRDHWSFGYETGKIARSIATGEGFSSPLFQKTGPTAWMTPLYPYLVAAVFKLFGVYTALSAVIMLSLNSIFSALTCVPIYFIASETFGTKVAGWSAWSWALFPYAIYLSSDIVWETCLTTLLVSLLFWMTLRITYSAGLLMWLSFGLLWGIAALSNPAVLALLPFLAAWIYFRLRQSAHVCGLRAAIALFGLIVVVTPWLVRNYQTFHRFIPFRDNFWLEVSLGNHGDTSLRACCEAHPSQSSRVEAEYIRLGELNYMSEKRREAIQFVRNQPLWFAKMTLRRIIFIWTGFWRMPPNGQFTEPFDPEEPFDPAHIAFNTTLSVLAMIGLVRALRRLGAAALPYSGVLFIFPILYYISNVNVRYRHPIDPEIVVLAAYGCVTRRARKRAPVEEEPTLEAEPAEPVLTTASV